MHPATPVSDMRIDEVSPIVMELAKGNKISTASARFDAVSQRNAPFMSLASSVI
jgi:hypothetical protein